MQSAKIQTRGRLTLPAEVREALKVEPGDQVTFTERSRADSKCVPKTDQVLCWSAGRSAGWP